MARFNDGVLFLSTDRCGCFHWNEFLSLEANGVKVGKILMSARPFDCYVIDAFALIEICID